METRDKAWTLYKKGLGCTEIAKRLGISPNTVKSWKKRCWDAPKSAPQECTQTHHKDAPQNRTAKKPQKDKSSRGGAPPGNLNGVGNPGGGAPPGNTNALKHGGWSAVMFGSWTDENREAIEQCDKSVDVEDLLVQELQLLTARESFLMQRIAKYSEKPNHVQHVHTSRTTRSFSRLDGDAELEERDKRLYTERIDEKVNSKDRLPGTAVDTSTTIEASYLIVERLERLLTDVQRQKSKVIQQLADLRRLNGSGANAVIDDWVNAITEGTEDG